MLEHKSSVGGLTLKVTCFENYRLPKPIDRRIGSDARTLKKQVPLKWAGKKTSLATGLESFTVVGIVWDASVILSHCTARHTST